MPIRLGKGMKHRAQVVRWEATGGKNAQNLYPRCQKNGGRSSRPCTTHVKHLALKLEARSDFDGGPYKVTYVG